MLSQVHNITCNRLENYFTRSKVARNLKILIIKQHLSSNIAYREAELLTISKKSTNS